MEETVLTRCIFLSPHCSPGRVASVGGSALQKELRQDGVLALQGMRGRRQRGGLWEDVLPSTRTSSSGNHICTPVLWLLARMWESQALPLSLGGC